MNEATQKNLPERKGRARFALFSPPRLCCLVLPLLLCICIQARAQSGSKKMTASFDQTSLKEIFAAIEAQTGYLVNYARDEVNTATKVTVQLKDVSAQEAIIAVLKSTPYTFSVEGFVFIVKAKRKEPSGKRNGKVTGVIRDEQSGQPVAGATVRIGGKGAISDANGTFVMELPAGTYKAVVDYIGYDAGEMAGISVTDTAIATVNVYLKKETGSLTGVVVKADRVITSTNQQLVSEVKNATGVVSGISSEQITISVDRSASEVARRVSGITLQDGFISIRGMTPRYNPVFLNGAYLPSTDPTKRAFNFDLLPSNVIDRILVYKTGAPELPADFAGGVVKIYTKKSVPVRRFELTINGQYRTGNKFFDDHISAGNGKYDWLGFDDGTRALPRGMPRDQYGMVAVPTAGVNSVPDAYSLSNERLTAALLQRAAKQWTLHQQYHPMDIQADATYYNYANLGSMKLNSVSLARYELQRSYHHSNSARDANRYADMEWPANGGLLTPYYSEGFRLMTDSVYTEDVRLAAMQHFSLDINTRNEVSLMLLYNHMAKDVLQINTSNEWWASGAEVYPRRIESAYNTQQLLTAAFSGTHKINNERHSIEWNGNFSQGRLYDPGQFSNLYMTDVQSVDGMYNGHGKLRLTDSTQWRMFGSTPNTVIGRFSDGEGKENRWQGNVDYIFQVAPSTWKELQLKAGAYYENRHKNYQFTPLRFDRFPDMPFTSDPWYSIGEILVEQNALRDIGYRMSTALETTGNPGIESQGYKAVVQNAAGYIALNVPLRFKVNNRQLQWDIYGGVRMEYMDRSILTLNEKNADDAGPFSIGGEAPRYTNYWLPSVNTTLHLSPRLQWRMAYAKTINRPELRELSPLVSYNPADGYTYQGYSGLVDARIDNFDARMEWYPSEGEMVMGGAYYKHIQNPIEDLNTALFKVSGFMPGNLPNASIYGAEIEVRKKLAFLGGALFRYMGVIVNASYNYTEADNRMPPVPNQPLNYYPGGKARPLQAASPWIINAGIFYDNKQSGSRISLQYNAYGDRLITNTGLRIDENPPVFDRTRHLVDISMLQKVTSHISVRIAAQNLLNAPIRQYVDGDFNKRYNTDPHQVVYQFQNNTTSPMKEQKFIQGDYYLKDYRSGIYYTIGFQVTL